MVEDFEGIHLLILVGGTSQLPLVIAHVGDVVRQ